MPTEGSITQWIGQLKAGEEQALEKLRQRYWPFLVGLAQKKLSGVRPGASDEEGVAQEAFWSFYQSFRAGQLPQLENRQNLFALLTIITAHKAADLRKAEGSAKRGGGKKKRGEAVDDGDGEASVKWGGSKVQGESVLGGLAGFDADVRGIEHVADSDIGPDEEAVASDLYSKYVDALSPDLREIAVQYLANRSLKEIAEALGCAAYTVQRKLQNFILPKWRKMAADSVNGMD